MGRIRRTREPVEEGHIVLLRRAAKMFQGGLLELIEVQGWGHKVIGNGQFVRAQGHPVFEPREVIECLWTTGTDPRGDVPPGLLELTEVVLCASQNLPARIRQPRGIRITKPIRAHAALLPDSLLSAAPASSVCIGPRASYRVKQNLGLAHGIELP